MNKVADGPHDLTPQWLSGALGTHVRAATPTKIGTGQTGAVYRIELDADDLPPTLMAKTATGDHEARARVATGYRVEVGFYAELASTVAVRTPRCWYTAISDDGLAFTLILDDLAPWQPGIQEQGCTIERASDAVRNLAGLHAPSWNDATLLERSFLERTDASRAVFLAGLAKSSTVGFVDRYHDQLDPVDAATLHDAAALMEPWILSSPDPFALVHGDYRLDNLMFPPEGDGVVAVDWQTLTVGPPGRDLAYFLGTSLRIEDRRDAERALVADYHHSLTSSGVTAYSLDDCRADYRLGHLQGPFITTIGCMYATGERSDASDQMFLAMIRRSCAAIRELDTLGAIQETLG